MVVNMLHSYREYSTLKDVWSIHRIENPLYFVLQNRIFIHLFKYTNIVITSININIIIIVLSFAL